MVESRKSAQTSDAVLGSGREEGGVGIRSERDSLLDHTIGRKCKSRIQEVIGARCRETKEKGTNRRPVGSKAQTGTPGMGRKIEETFVVPPLSSLR
jgi:hypothetical protein